MQLAQVDINKEWPLATNTNFQTLGGMVSFFLPKILLAGGIVFFLLIVIAGIGVIKNAGSGDAHTSEQARNFLTYAVIGLILMLGAVGILQIINFLTFGSLQSIL